MFYDEFILSYADDAVYAAVASKIVEALKNGTATNVRSLSAVVITQIDNRIERQIATAFFHPGGSQNAALNELMNKHYSFIKEEPRTP